MESDPHRTGDWGAVPFIDVGTPNQGQDAAPYPSGFAIFFGGAGEGGFQYAHMLFLTVTFEPQDISTVWGKGTMAAIYVPS